MDKIMSVSRFSSTLEELDSSSKADIKLISTLTHNLFTTNIKSSQCLSHNRSSTWLKALYPMDQHFLSISLKRVSEKFRDFPSAQRKLFACAHGFSTRWQYFTSTRSVHRTRCYKFILGITTIQILWKRSLRYSLFIFVCDRNINRQTWARTKEVKMAVAGILISNRNRQVRWFGYFKLIQFHKVEVK